MAIHSCNNFHSHYLKISLSPSICISLLSSIFNFLPIARSSLLADEEQYWHSVPGFCNSLSMPEHRRGQKAEQGIGPCSDGRLSG